jgi:WS/DGAT/MGAT family acyltransferase
VAKQIAHAHDATVNDVLMTAMAGGLRALLLARGEGVERIALRAYVPMSLHREPPGKARGNLDGMMVVRLPVGVADPVERLRMIAAETAGRRKLRRTAGGALFRFPFLQRLLMRLMSRQRWANTYAANVPGPSMPLYFAGARVLELFPLVPLTGNITVGIGALSYAGQFNITVVADQDACPDIGVFVQGLQDDLRSLTAAKNPEQAKR